MDSHIDKELLGISKAENVNDTCLIMPTGGSVESLPVGDLTDYIPSKDKLSDKDLVGGSENGADDAHFTGEKCDLDHKGALAIDPEGKKILGEADFSAAREAVSRVIGNNFSEGDQFDQTAKSEASVGLVVAVSNENEFDGELKEEMPVNVNLMFSPNDDGNANFETSHCSQMKVMVKNKPLCTDVGCACELNGEGNNASAVGQEELLGETSKADNAQILSSETRCLLVKESEQNERRDSSSSGIKGLQFREREDDLTAEVTPVSNTAIGLCKLDESVENNIGLQGNYILDIPCEAGESRAIGLSFVENERSSIISNHQSIGETQAGKQVLSSVDKGNDQIRNVSLEIECNSLPKSSTTDKDKMKCGVSLKPCSLSEVDPSKRVECESSGFSSVEASVSSVSCKEPVVDAQNDEECGVRDVPRSDFVGGERCPKTDKQSQKDSRGVSSSDVNGLEDAKGDIFSSVTTSVMTPETGSPTVISSKEQSKVDDISTGDQKKTSSLTDRNHSVVKSNMDCISDDDRSFSFQVAAMEDTPVADNNKCRQSFCEGQSSQQLQTVKQDQALGLCPIDGMKSHDDPVESKKVSNASVGTVKIPSTNKRKSLSRNASAKDSTTKEKVTAKSNSTRKRKSEKGTDNNRGLEERLSQEVEPHKMQLSSGSGNSIAKQSEFSIIQTSYVPDSNSLLSSTLFHQPFTDVQQVQLRAQIFVYGSLIQGTPPDESYMISAFGNSTQDDVKSEWNAAWKIAVGKLSSNHNPKAPASFPSLTGAKVSEPVNSSGIIQSKTPANQTGLMSIVPNNIISSSMGVPSTLGYTTSISQDGLQSTNLARAHTLDFYQSLSVSHPYQSPQMKQYMGNTLPWLSQPAVSVSNQHRPQPSTFEAGKQYGMLSTGEAVQVAPAQELYASNSNLRAAVSAGVNAPLVPVNVLPPSGKHAPDGQKSRRKRKTTSSEETFHGQTTDYSNKKAGSMTHDVSKPIVSSVVPSNSMPASSVISACNFVIAGSSNHPSPHVQVVPPGADVENADPAAILCSRSEKEKLSSDDNASIATSAVIHCQKIWEQLSAQKNSGLVSEIEEKLAAAAVAATAASLVARAASTAAKLAAEVVVKSKIMADEAIKAVTTSNLSSKDNEKASIIVAAKEAARKRVEAASAAARRAENLDSIVRAAELAADSLAQAGTIVAMDEPAPAKVSELFERGLEGFWRLKLVSKELRHDPSCASSAKATARKLLYEDQSSKNEFQDRVGGGKVISCEVLSPRENFRVDDSNPVTSEKKMGHVVEDSNILNTASTNKYLEPEKLGSFTDKNDQITYQLLKVPIDGYIKKGSTVEVFSNEGDLRGTWFTAKVYDLKDGRAFVCYDELCEDKSTDRLKEWIPLKGEGDEPPRLRIAGPIIAPAKYEGTRKRRRAAMGNCKWSVGDKVDVWMHGGWREATISERDKNDDTKLTVQFSVEGDSYVARDWNLRPSIRWKDGKWTEYTRQKDIDLHEGDTPEEKRRKVQGANTSRESKLEDREKGESLKDMALEDAKKQEETCSTTKPAGGEKNSETSMMKRTGLQKEGAKVVFGIPKPGKKGKFMDVSRNGPAVKPVLQTTDGPDSTKFTKNLIPQGPSRGWSRTPKVDTGRKQPPIPKPKMTRAVKAQTSKSVPDSVTQSINQQPSSLEVVENVKGTLGEGGSSSSKEKALEISLSSNPDESSEIVASDGNAGNTGEDGGNELSGDINKGKQDSNNLAEPRRSSRKIQPTSKLLEGLQSSSLIVSKMPIISHDMDA